MQLMQILIKRLQALEDAYHAEKDRADDLTRRLERAEARAGGIWNDLAEQDGKIAGRINSMDDRLASAERAAQAAGDRLRDETTRIETLFARAESLDRRLALVSDVDDRLEQLVHRVIDIEARKDPPAFRNARLLERLEAVESRVTNVETHLKEAPTGSSEHVSSSADLDARLGQLAFQAKGLEEKFSMLDSLRSVLGDPEMRTVIDEIEMRLQRIDAQIATLFTLQRVSSNGDGVVRLAD